MVENVTSAEEIYQVEAMLPATKVRYCGVSFGDTQTVEDLRITMTIDFPLGTDLDKE